MHRPVGRKIEKAMTSGSQDKSDPTSAKTSQDARSIHLAANRIDSKDLFAASREITIAHGDDIYRLRLTSQNKLILTK
jgi:hemin uptake protein HemP